MDNIRVWSNVPGACSNVLPMWSNVSAHRRIVVASSAHRRDAQDIGASGRDESWRIVRMHMKCRSASNCPFMARFRCDFKSTSAISRFPAGGSEFRPNPGKTCGLDAPNMQFRFMAHAIRAHGACLRHVFDIPDMRWMCLGCLEQRPTHRSHCHRHSYTLIKLPYAVMP